MKKNLAALPEAKLRTIARDFSIVVGNRKEIETELAAYLRAYGLVWSDLAARYELV